MENQKIKEINGNRYAHQPTTLYQHVVTFRESTKKGLKCRLFI